MGALLRKPRIGFGMRGMRLRKSFRTCMFSKGGCGRDQYCFEPACPYVQTGDATPGATAALASQGFTGFICQLSL